MKRKCLSIAIICLGSALAQTGGPETALGIKNVTFVVRLLSPLSTKTARQGDAFTAAIEEPAQFQGGMMEGHITKMHRPQKGVGKGKAEMQFQFERLIYNNRASVVKADLKQVQNSQGARKVDEEGRVIGMTSNKKRLLSTVLLGSAGVAIGAAAGGASGAAAGGAAGVAAGLLIGLKLTTTGADIEFRPGSTFTLSVSDARRR